MRCDDELRDFHRRELMQDAQERQLSTRRKRGLRLVEQIHAILDAILEQRKKRLAVRLLVQSLAAIRKKGAPHFFEIRREVEEGLRPQEEPIGDALSPL